MVSAIPDADYGLDKFALMAASANGTSTRARSSRSCRRLRAFDDRPAAKRFVTPADKGVPAATYGVNLPSGYHMDEAKVDLVCRALKEILGV